MRVASSTPLWVTEEVPKVPIQFKEPVSKQVKRNELRAGASAYHG